MAQPLSSGPERFRSLHRPDPLDRSRTACFSGLTARHGPLTTGQANMVRCMLTDPPEHMNYRVVRAVQPGTTLAVVTEAVRRLVTRHESLRTTFHDGLQRVLAAGEVTVEVHDTGLSPAVPEDAGTCESDLAEQVARRLQGTRFALDTEIPLRVAVIASGGVPRQVVLVTTHSAMDAAGLAVVLTEWDELLLGKPLAPVTAPQPLDVVAAERTPAGLRRAESALRYWERHLRAVPRSTLTVPVDGETDWLLPRLRVRSVPAAGALGRISARTGASPSAAVLAALAALAGVRARQRTVVVLSISANRFRPELREYVGPLAQDALIPVETGADGFDAVLRGARSATMTAYQNSRFDADALIRIMEDVQRERGLFFARDIVFNDMSVPGRGPRAVRGGEDVHSVWLPPAVLPTRTSLWVHRTHGELDVTLWADPRCLPRGDALALGEGIARLLIEAGDRDVPRSELTALTGVVPVPRDDGWLPVDGCWVHLPEVGRLTADALARLTGGDGTAPTAETAVVAEADERLGHRLVCFTTAATTPAALHSACLGLLPGRMSAMAPHHYVVCAAAPSPGTSWQDLPRVTEGSGR
ncbi:condensation domain-containing protein [Streptosporangium sp. NPDC050855]|uniref:condensation domain-containing protein n=1 Tax=Streptosporangium sp. NPDC050855 TaxID=3366194 RepID=UPI00379A2D1E